MPNPNHPVGAEVDPSEGAIDEGAEQQQQRARAADDEGQESAMHEVDPSEGPTQQ